MTVPFWLTRVEREKCPAMKLPREQGWSNLEKFMHQKAQGLGNNC